MRRTQPPLSSRFVGAVFALFCCAGSVSAATLYVAQGAAASDRNPGTNQRPLRTIQAGVNRLSPGDRLIIRAGTYRERVMVARSGRPEAPIEISAAHGEKVVITGADPVPPERWRPSGRPGVWLLTPWTYTSRPKYHPSGQPLIGRSEQVLADGQFLRQVLKEGEMAPGTFMADGAATHRLLVWLPHGDSPSQHTVLTSVRPLLMRITGSYVTVRNLGFELASNLAQQGALVIQGSHNLVENCTVERTNGVGIELAGENNIGRKLTARFNGQMGMAGHGRFNTLEECALDGNNVKGFPWGWEAGGIKVAGTQTFRIVKCLTRRNSGPGFWYDFDNRNSTIEESYAADNVGPGVEIEISQDITVRNNVCLRNARGDSLTLNSAAGILIAESMNVLVEHNVALGNRVGIALRSGSQRVIPASPEKGRMQAVTYQIRNPIIRYNVMANNTQYQFAAWGTSPQGGVRLEHNLFFAPTGQGLIAWGNSIRQKSGGTATTSPSRSHILQLLGPGAVFAPPEFKDAAGGDYALAPQSPGAADRIGLLLAVPHSSESTLP
jgi:hypothetical protein